MILHLRNLIASATLLLCTVQRAEARLKIPFGNREVLTKVADLPNTNEYRASANSSQYIDLARLHGEFNIAWILPLWITEEPRLVGYVQGKNEYYELPEDELQQILKENKLDKDQLLKLGFYTRYGGKLMGLLILALIVYGLLPDKNKKEVKPKIV